MNSTAGVLPKVEFNSRCKGHLWIWMNDWFRCSPPGRGQDFLNATFPGSWLTPFSMITVDPPAALHILPASLHWSRAPSPGACLCLSAWILTHSFCCTVTNTNLPHLQATSGLFHTSHHLIGGSYLCSAFNASLLFSYYVSWPLYLSMKKNKIKFCLLHISVVSCCRPCSDFLLHSLQTLYSPAVWS